MLAIKHLPRQWLVSGGWCAALWDLCEMQTVTVASYYSYFHVKCDFFLWFKHLSLCVWLFRELLLEKNGCAKGAALNSWVWAKTFEFWMPLILGYTQIKIIYVILPASSFCGLWKYSALEIFVRYSSKSSFPQLLLNFWCQFCVSGSHSMTREHKIWENGIGILSWSFKERVQEDRTGFSIPGASVKTFNIFCAPQDL